MRAWPKPLDGWCQSVTAHVLLPRATGNVRAFPAIEAQAARVSEKQFAEFLDETFSEYRRKAAMASWHGWFCAWFDPNSATLRCSLYEADDLGDLPFRCKLNVV